MVTRTLFVDDEEGIRATLAPILEQHGFAVTTSATVREALEKIHQSVFDVLVSDLNIGQPGDGFTVVSAMRRVQPQAATFILTGYPDFDTALQAIRSQVDDYLMKPTDVPTLIHTIRHRLEHRRPALPDQPLKLVSQLLRETLNDISQRWLQLVKAHPELAAIPLSDAERLDHLPVLIRELSLRVAMPGEETSPAARAAAEQHGLARAQHGYTIPMIVVEMRLLQHAISSILQCNLIRMDLSTVIQDMMQVGESLHEQLEYSIRGFQKNSYEAA